MPYTPDATDVTQPADTGIKATTAPAEFRTLKILTAALRAGTQMFTQLGIGRAATVALDVYSATANGAIISAQNASGTTAGYIQLQPGNSAFGAPVLELNNTQAGAIQRTFMSARAGMFRMLNQSSGGFNWGINGGAEYMQIADGGAVGIGTTANVSALLDVQSTTRGFRLPNMTTAQKTVIASPAAGLMVFDTTLGKACLYTGAAWQTITSV